MLQVAQLNVPFCSYESWLNRLTDERTAMRIALPMGTHNIALAWHRLSYCFLPDRASQSRRHLPPNKHIYADGNYCYLQAPVLDGRSPSCIVGVALVIWNIYHNQMYKTAHQRATMFICQNTAAYHLIDIALASVQMTSQWQDLMDAARRPTPSSTIMYRTLIHALYSAFTDTRNASYQLQTVIIPDIKDTAPITDTIINIQLLDSVHGTLRGPMTSDTRHCDSQLKKSMLPFFSKGKGKRGFVQRLVVITTLRRSGMARGISQFYLHTPRTSANGMNHTFAFPAEAGTHSVTSRTE